MRKRDKSRDFGGHKKAHAREGALSGHIGRPKKSFAHKRTIVHYGGKKSHKKAEKSRTKKECFVINATP